MDAEAFAQIAQEDDTNQMSDQNATSTDQTKNIDKAPAWSGANSLESGDVGTRNYQLGLPRAGAV